MSRRAALLAFALVLALPGSARAQACCAGSTALSPGRLNLHEQALAGLVLKATDLFGSFDSAGRFVGGSHGAAEVDLEQDLVATVRVLRHGQLSMIMPLVETYRRVPGIDEAGAGIGDVQLTARWDFTLAGARVILPGIAALASLTMPTGVAPEAATKSLATDATGTGSWQGALGVSLEQTFRRVFVNVTGSAAVRSARDVQGLHTQLGPAFTAFAATGWMFDAGPVAALTASYTGELPAVIDGKEVADGGRRALRLGVSCGYPFNDAWRIQGGLFGDPPISGIGKNEPAGVGLAATVLRTW